VQRVSGFREANVMSLFPQTMLEAYTQNQRCSSSQYKSGAPSSVNTDDSSDALCASSIELNGFTSPAARFALESAHDCDDLFPSRYQACVSMIR